MWFDGPAFLLFSCCWMAHTATPYVQPDEPVLTVRIYGEADSQERRVPRAIDFARRIFADAGIRLLWVDCAGDHFDAACVVEPAANEFVVRVRSRLDNRPSHGCGVSLRPKAGVGHYVTVFQDCIRAASDDLHLPETVLLACTIAHEIGHLLLPLGHASSGIMRARPDKFDWERAAQGALGFSPAERQQMVQALRVRLVRK